MTFVFENILVDSGTIFVGDPDMLRELGADEMDEIGSENVHEIDNGHYHVNWEIPDTWNGDIDGTGTVRITSGKIVVIDPCYVFSDKSWDKVLDKTNSMEELPKGCFIIDEMGGDGKYEVTLNLR